MDASEACSVLSLSSVFDSYVLSTIYRRIIVALSVCSGISSQDFWMIRSCIPAETYSLTMPSLEVTIPDTRHADADFTVYILRVTSSRGSKLSEVRYSQFYELHKKLRRSIKPYPEFPARRLIRKLDPKVVETRRQRLEAYLQALVSQDPVHHLVLEFLDVPKDDFNSDFADGSVHRDMQSHHTAALCCNWDEINRWALNRVQPNLIQRTITGTSNIHADGVQDNALTGMLVAMYH